MKIQLITSLAITAFITLPSLANAEEFWVSGNVTRTLIENNNEFGNCMVQLSNSLDNGCRSSWVSLDCSAKYSKTGDGDRMLNIALLAQNLNKHVSVKFDNSQTYDGYCVARRIDLLQ